MLISTEKGGGEIVSARDETRFYDDIACLAADWTAHHDGATAFVRLVDGTWTRASDASYAQPSAERTAMGSGLAAYATIVEARAADRSGRVLSWDEVVQLPGAKR
jgi:nitrous oxide reductase accessory protein NosL